MSIADMLNGLSEIIEGKVNQLPDYVSGPLKAFARINPITGVPMQVNDVIQGNFIENERKKAAGLAQIPGDLVSGVPGIYGLANRAPRLWGGEDVGLPAADDALKLATDVQDTNKEIGAAVAGQPVDNSLLDGTSADLAASWGRLIVPSVISAPSAITSRIANGIKILEDSKGLAARAGEYAVKGLEMVTPIMMRPPTPGIQAANLGIAGGLGVGLELAFPDPDKKQLDATIAKAADVGTAHGEQAQADVNAVRTAVNPVQASILPSTGDETLDKVLPYAAGAAAIFAGYKTNVLGRVIKAMGKHKDETVLEGSDILRRQLVDKMVPAKVQYENVLRSQGNPNAETFGKAMGNEIDAATGAAMDTKMSSYFDYGEMVGSAVKAPPMKDWYTKISTLTPQETDLLRRGILSRGEYFDDTVRAVRDAPTRAADWAAVNSNPKLQAAVREYDTITHKLMDYALEQKRITPAEHRQLTTDNSLSFPRQLSEAGMDSKSSMFRSNVRQSSGGDPITDLPNFAQKVIRQTEWNKVQRSIIESFRQAENAGDPLARSFMGRRDIRGVTDKDAQIIKYRDHMGNVRSQEFTDPYLYKALKAGNDISRLHAIAGASPILRAGAMTARGLQQGATGAIAAAVGQPFAHIAAWYNAMFGAITREPGTAAGLADAAAQRLGFKFGIPGDPTILAQSSIKAMEGILGVMAKRASDSLHNHVVKSAGFSGSINPSAATRMADTLKNFYEKTWVHEFQQNGLLGPATYGGIDPDRDIANVIKRMRTNNVPMQVVRDTYHFVNDIMHAVAASPGAAVYANNKNLRPELRARAVRELTGDTGRTGAYDSGFGKAVGGVGTMTPWWNVFVQSSDKFARSLSTPQKMASTITGATTMIGIPTISVGLWTAGLDPMYADYKYNRRGPDKQAANMYIPIPGLPPEDGLEIPIDPVMRGYHLAMELMVGHHIGLFNGELFKPENTEMRTAFSEMARNRWFGAGKNTVGGSVIEQSVLPPVAPIIAAPMAAMGINMRSYIDSNEIHKRNDAGYTTSDARNPFRDVLGMHESAAAENVVRTLGAGAAQLGYDIFMGSAQIANEGGDVSKMLKRASQTIGLGTKDRFAKLGIMDGFAAISPSQEAAGQLVSDKLKGLQKQVDAYRATTKGGAPTEGNIIGTKQRGFQQVEGGQLSVAPPSEQDRIFGMYAEKKLAMIQKEFVGPNKDDYAHRQGLQISTQYSPEHKRAKMNELSERIIERNRTALLQLQQFEAQMSNHFKTPIQLDKLNLNKGISSK